MASEDPKSFGVNPAVHSHDACLEQVDRAHYLVLIVGGRRGGTYVGSENSITNEEYRRARRRGLPIFTLVLRAVCEAELAFAKNPTGNFSYVVDDTAIFDFVKLVRTESQGNWVSHFETVEDIKAILTMQFAHMCLLMAERLIGESRPTKGKRRASASVPLPPEFGRILALEGRLAATDTIAALQQIHRVISGILAAEIKSQGEQLKVLWLFGRYGTLDNSITRKARLEMSEPEFRDRAWGESKGNRVFAQMAAFGVHGDYEHPDHYDEHAPRHSLIRLSFEEDEGGLVAAALVRYVADLLAECVGDDNAARELFFRADMRLYREAPPKQSEGPKPAKKKAVPKKGRRG